MLETKKKFYRLPELLNRYGISKAFVYRGVREGWFPRPVRLGPRAIAWTSEALDTYESTLVETGWEEKNE